MIGNLRGHIISREARFTDLDKIAIGNKVKLIFRKIQDEGVSGLHCYGYKAIVM